MPQSAEAAKVFNRQLRVTLEALGASGGEDFRHAFVCECGCGEVAKITLSEYERRSGAWLEGHAPVGRAKGGAVETHKVVDAGDVDAQHGVFRALTDQLGVAGFRVNQLELGAGAEGPEHDHLANEQEEVYAVIAGGGVLLVGGEKIPVRPGHFVYLPPHVRRQMVAGEDGLTWIGIGSAAVEAETE